ncbi:MAG: hypothetical protein OEZ43_00815 [Gammaproteobacteria bacterium]|nr:hypothetical protein [Gammaproteobacteria bacterium]
MSQIVLACDDNYADNSICYIDIQASYPEHEQIWIWDHYFTLVMHRLCDTEESTLLLDSLANWAAGCIPEMYSPVNELHQKAALKIDTQLSLRALEAPVPSEYYLIEADQRAGEWPQVMVKLPEAPSAARLAYSVIALAQYFLGKNILFFRELPLHVLAIRKYYQEQKGPIEPESVAQAPIFAVEAALKFFTDANKKAKAE